MAKAPTTQANPSADPKATAPAAPENETADERENSGPAISVTARAPRRRAGYRFGPVPVKIPIGDLTAAQKKALAEDPELHIKEADQE